MDRISNLKIISINVNSLIKNQRRAQMMKLLDKNNPDVVLISETKLNKSHVIEFKNYEIIRNDRPHSKQGGGTAILIKRKIKFERVELTNVSRDTAVLEATMIRLFLGNKKNLIIVAAYAAGNNKIEFNEEFKNLFRQLRLENLDNYYIIAGDLNAKHMNWKNSNYNTRGTFLYNWLLDNSITYRAILRTSEIPTFPRGKSYLDVCIADCRLSFKDTKENGDLRGLEYDSDHNALHITISISNRNEDITIETADITHRYNYRLTDWQKYSRYLNKNCNLDIPTDRNLTIKEIDEHLKTIEKKILEAIEATVPTIKHRDTVKLYTNAYTKKLQKQKSYVLTQINNMYRNSNRWDSDLMERLKYTMNNIKYKLKIEFQRNINAYWRNKISKITHKDSKNMFPQINRIFRPKDRAQVKEVKVRTDDNDLLDRAQLDKNKLIIDDAGHYNINEGTDKLNVIGAHFARIHDRNDDLGQPRLTELVNKITNKIKLDIEENLQNEIKVVNFSKDITSDAPLNCGIKNYFTTSNSLGRIFAKLNNKKSSGFDGIPNIALRHISKKIVTYYSVLFNNALNWKYFPRDWKHAKVIALKKPGKDDKKLDNYRPISLLSNIGKIYEVIINKALLKICDDKEIIPE